MPIDWRAETCLIAVDSTLSGNLGNGSPIGSQLGPFRIVVPNEKHQMRWVRNVTEVAVFTAT